MDVKIDLYEEIDIFTLTMSIYFHDYINKLYDYRKIYFLGICNVLLYNV